MPAPDKTSTAPRLYAEALALVHDARAVPSAAALLLAEAQVLATLSLVAATAGAALGVEPTIRDEWL